MPTIAIAAIIPPVAGSMYWSANDAGACVGSGVVSGASVTLMAVSADEGQYDSEPSNEAYTVYSPGTSGSNASLKKPSMLLVVLPTS